MQNVPPEIFSRIVKLACQTPCFDDHFGFRRSTIDDAQVSLPTLFVIAQVCGAWRSCVRNNQLLWRNISATPIFNSTSGKWTRLHVNLIKESLNLAGMTMDLSLHLAPINMFNGVPDNGDGDILAMFFERGEQCRALSIQFNDYLFSRFRNESETRHLSNCFRNLETLEIDLSETSTYSEEYIRDWIRSLPSLRQIYLSNRDRGRISMINSIYDIPLSGLQAFHFRDTYSATDAIQIIRTLKSTIKIDLEFRRSWERYIPLVVQLSSNLMPHDVSELALRQCHDPLTVLNSFMFTNLRSLTIAISYADYTWSQEKSTTMYEGIINLLRRLPNPLEKLVIQDHYMYENDVEKLLTDTTFEDIRDVDIVYTFEPDSAQVQRVEAIYRKIETALRQKEIFLYMAKGRENWCRSHLQQYMCCRMECHIGWTRYSN